MGNCAMLNYDRIRITLRGLKKLSVVLTEIPKKDLENIDFPPIIERNKDHSSDEAINWNKYKHIPLLFWVIFIFLINFNIFNLYILNVAFALKIS